MMDGTHICMTEGMHCYDIYIVPAAAAAGGL